jgi:hypothetical protein
MNATAKKDTVTSTGLSWSLGDFHVPGFSSDGRTGLVPGAPDTHRRLFLTRASGYNQNCWKHCANCRSKTRRFRDDLYYRLNVADFRQTPQRISDIED